MRFGGPLSPEFFDKHLPPSTPLQKGGTPARALTPGGALRSALKTPQRSDDDAAAAAAAHPDLDVLSAFGASPVLKMPRNRRMASVGEDEDGQVRRRAAAALAAMRCTCSAVPASSGFDQRLKRNGTLLRFPLPDFPADDRGDGGRDDGRRRSVFSRHGHRS